MGAEDSMSVREIYPLFPKEIRPGRPEERALIFLLTGLKQYGLKNIFQDSRGCRGR
jgi:hypothetical protein